MSNEQACSGASSAPLFSARQEGGIHVITFSRPNVLDAFHPDQLGEGIFGQLHAADVPTVVLDLHNVELLSSSALGVLISLNALVEDKRVQSSACSRSHGGQKLSQKQLPPAPTPSANWFIGIPTSTPIEPTQPDVIKSGPQDPDPDRHHVGRGRSRRTS